MADNDTFIRNGWAAMIKAQFELAGVRDFDARNQAFLVPAGSIQNSFPRLVDPSNKVMLASFNAQLSAIADQMPPADSTQWGVFSNRRYANYGAYLSLVDPGGKYDGAYQQQYDDAYYRLEQEKPKWGEAYTQAHEAFSKSSTTKGFEWWVRNEYWGAEAYLSEKGRWEDLNDAFELASANLYGPESRPKTAWLKAWSNGTESLDPADGYVMSAAMTGSMDQTQNLSYLPAYNVDRQMWSKQCQTWTAMATQPEGEPAASASVIISQTSDVDLSNYGLKTTTVSADMELPWLFWGKMDFNSKNETEKMYRETHVNNATITMTSRFDPITIPITPGKWYTSNPMTVFPHLLSGPATPADPSALIYPFVASVVVAYDVGYKITLDPSSFTSLHTLVTKDTDAKACFGLLGWIFKFKAQGEHHERSVDGFDRVTFDETTNTVVVRPTNSGNPTILGVIVGKKPGLQALPPVLPPQTPTDFVQSAKLFVSDFVAALGSLSNSSRLEVRRVIRNAFRCRRNGIDFSDLCRVLGAAEDQAAGRTGDNDEQEVSLEQYFKTSTLVITVRNKNLPGPHCACASKHTVAAHKQHGGCHCVAATDRKAQDLFLFSEKAREIGTLFSQFDTDNGPSRQAAFVILQGLARCASLKNSSVGEVCRETHWVRSVGDFVQDLLSLSSSVGWTNIDATVNGDLHGSTDSEGAWTDPATVGTEQPAPVFVVARGVVTSSGLSNLNGSLWVLAGNQVDLSNPRLYRLVIEGVRPGCDTSNFDLFIEGRGRSWQRNDHAFVGFYDNVAQEMRFPLDAQVGGVFEGARGTLAMRFEYVWNGQPLGDVLEISHQPRTVGANGDRMSWRIEYAG